MVGYGFTAPKRYEDILSVAQRDTWGNRWSPTAEEHTGSLINLRELGGVFRVCPPSVKEGDPAPILLAERNVHLTATLREPGLYEL